MYTRMYVCMYEHGSLYICYVLFSMYNLLMLPLLTVVYLLNVHMYVFIYVHTYISMYVCMYTHVSMRIRMYVATYTFE